MKFIDYYKKYLDLKFEVKTLNDELSNNNSEIVNNLIKKEMDVINNKIRDFENQKLFSQSDIDNAKSWGK